MWGAVIGDLAGSLYEYNQTKTISSICIQKINLEKSFFSDDTILTIAILEAILHKKDYESCLKKYVYDFIDYYPDINPYFKSPFSPSFIRWVKGTSDGKSIGNGALMRISAVGYLFDDEVTVPLEAIKATIPSHNSEEAIRCAKLVSLIILLARKGYTKEEIIKRLSIKLKYKPFLKFNTTCNETIGNCLYALFNSNSYEEAIMKVISYGGDTDTNACIVGSMAEALFGVPNYFILNAQKKIPESFTILLEEGYRKVRKLY